MHRSSVGSSPPAPPAGKNREEEAVKEENAASPSCMHGTALSEALRFVMVSSSTLVSSLSLLFPWTFLFLFLPIALFTG